MLNYFPWIVGHLLQKAPIFGAIIGAVFHCKSVHLELVKCTFEIADYKIS